MKAAKDQGSSEKTRHHASYVPALSIEERDRRWELLRKRMLVDGLDCLLLYGNNIKWGMGMVNVRYVTHIGCGAGAFAVFPLVGEPVVWTDLAHQHIPSHRYLYTQNWIRDIRPDKGPGPVVEYLKEKNYGKGHIGLVGYSAGIMSGDIIPATVVDYLHKELSEVVFSNATGLVNYYRLIKSREEIGFLEQAGKIARKVIDTLIRSAEPGKKECEVFADMVHTQISSGAEPEIFIMFTSGPVAGPGNDKQLLHGAHYPAIPTTRALEKGDLILMEFHIGYAGYLAAAEFSLYLGRAPAELKRIHEVSVQCFENLQKAMKPGATFEEVIESERKPCEQAGMDYIELGFHQHGLGSAGPLTMVYKPGGESLSGNKVGKLKIQENMVFGSNIDIHDPGWKKDVGIMLGDTLQITAEGSRCLVNTPLTFFEKEV